MPPSRVISGTLPWEQATSAAGPVTPADPASLQASYNRAYQSALAFNRANYENIIRGYQQTAAAQRRDFRGIRRGYRRLLDSVLEDIENVGDAERQAIADAYAAARGQSVQDLASAGLGNTTVRSAIERGLTLDQAKAEVDLASRLAQLAAGYRSSIGSASLDFRNQAALAQAQLAQNQLNMMNSVSSPYPDPGFYAQLAQMYGLQQAAEEAQRSGGAAPMPQGGGLMGALYRPTGGPGGRYSPFNYSPIGNVGGGASPYTPVAPSVYQNNLYNNYSVDGGDSAYGAAIGGLYWGSQPEVEYGMLNEMYGGNEQIYQNLREGSSWLTRLTDYY